MSEIIWGIDIKPIKQVCKEHGIMCEFATELGYCKITGCVRRPIRYGAKMMDK